MSIVFYLVAFSWINFGLEVPFLSVVFESLVEVGHWQSIVHNVTRILHGHFEKLLEVLVLGIFLQIVFLPAIGTFPIPNQYIKVTVQQQNNVLFQFVDIQLHRHWSGSFRAVSDQGRLDHHHTVGN